MFAGILGTSDLSANVITSVYRNLKDKASAVTVNVCNRSGASGKVSIAVSSSNSTPTTSEWVLFEAPINASDTIEKLGILVPSGKYVLVQSSIPNTNTVIYGVQTGEDL